MNDDLLLKIQTNPKFRELVHKKTGLGWRLTIAMLVIYYGFIVMLAFSPATLGTPLSAGSVTTLGIPVGIFIILSAFCLTGIYVFRANNEFDRLNREIIEETR
jgi:uncharacterized membrane protein (DUF485 family)